MLRQLPTTNLPYHTDFAWHDDDCSVVITYRLHYSYRPPTPDVRYLSNGDPGYPGDPAEVDWQAVGVVKACFVDEHTLRSFEWKLDAEEKAALIERLNQYCKRHDSLSDAIYDHCCQEQEA